jgi:glycosyltransferase involved in cell wall biosynthesis
LLVTRELSGFYGHSDAGAAMAGLAQELAAEGDAVTVLLVPPLGVNRASYDEKISGLARWYKELFLVDVELLASSRATWRHLNSHQVVAFAVLDYVRTHPVDVVYFAVEDGLGFYLTLARETGCFATDALLWAVVHAPAEWRAEAGRAFFEKVSQFTADFMERSSVATADGLICATESMRAWLCEKGWTLPPRTSVLPRLRPAEWRETDGLGRPGIPGPRPINEVVFAGCSEYREGLTLFCDALDRLAERGREPLKTTFIGPFGRILGEHTGGMMLRRARRWPFELLILPFQTPQETLAYLKRGDRLLVASPIAADMPMLLESCLQDAIPFVATEVGGIAERIASADRKRCLARQTATELARVIADALAGPFAPATPVLSDALVREAWAAHQRSLSASRAGDQQRASRIGEPPPQGQAKRPLVSIIMAHRDRPELIVQAIRSVEKQDYTNIELIVVDDGSERPESHALLSRLEPVFAARGWRILREPNRYLGAARNAGIRVARGPFILFLDDDNVLFENAVSTLVRALERTGADICTCFAKVLFDKVPPVDPSSSAIEYLPTGGPLDIAVIQNPFGDANAMFRSTVFERIGMLVEDYGFACQDWEIFTRAALKGLKLRVVPEPLYWYRSNPEGMYRSSHWYENRGYILDLFRRNKFRGLQRLYQLAIAHGVDAGENRSLHYNLQWDPANAPMLRLAALEPNSTDAVDLLAEIAAAEGRPAAALALLAQRSKPAEGRLLQLFEKPDSLRAQALAESAGQFVTEDELQDSYLREFVITSTPRLKPPIVAYYERDNRLYFEARPHTISVASLSAAGSGDVLAGGVLAVTADVSIDEEMASPTEFMVALIPPDADPVGIAERFPADGLPVLAGSGWRRVSRMGRAISIEARLPSPSTDPVGLLLAMKLVSSDSGRATIGCFSRVRIRRWQTLSDVRHPRLGAPPQRQRARALSTKELHTAKLLTNYPSKHTPGIGVLEKDGGLFLRPSEYGIVLAALPRAFPPFARRLIASVEVAHEQASPFEFAMALARPEDFIEWKTGVPEGAVGFSEWLRVEERFERKELQVEVPAPTRMHFSLQLAIRVPPGSKAFPSHTIWRKFVLAWE